ncbi:MAG: hypothetical protein WBV94_18435 [Blastocatellia bacterium]
MRSKLFAFAIALIFILASTAAGDEPVSIPKSDLDTHPFTSGDLKITITGFRTGSLLTRAAIRVRVENTSGNAATFNPQRLSFVISSNRQINVRPRRQGHQLDLLSPIEIAPGAYIKETYDLDGKVPLPARLFYEGRELASITD